MYIHKIETDKHQEFLLQNRKDPITGDLIQSTDEVVFCASCKSVFLADTWIYLNETHCEQSKTLTDFPSSSVMNLKAEEHILFYQALPSTKNSQEPIPSQTKKTPWIHQQTIISPYQNWFYNPFITGFKVTIWVVGLFLFFVYNSPLVIIAFLVSFVLAMIEMIHNWHYGKKVTSIFKKIRNNTFYITNKSIGFSEAYGMNKYILATEDIQKLVFHENKGTFTSTYCEIFYLHFLQDSNSFFDSLKTLSASTHFPIHIKSKNDTTLFLTQQTIAEGFSNFRIESEN